MSDIEKEIEDLIKACRSTPHLLCNKSMCRECAVSFLKKMGRINNE